jgi:uncharacterized membrane protein YdjX (TVP38/TMEM64 family)
MTAKPGLTAVTSPVAVLTVATSAREVVHATGRPVSTAPAASRAVAESVIVEPIASERSSDEIETELAVTVGAVDLSPPQPANAATAANEATDLRTSTLLRQAVITAHRGFAALVHSVMAHAPASPASRRVAVLRLALLVTLLVGAALAWWQFGPTDPLSFRDAVRRARAMRDTGWAAPTFLLFYAGASALGLPITPFTLAAGVIFGVALGATLSWAGAVIGAAGGYLLARHLGATAVRTLAGSRAGRIEQLTESTGFLTLLRVQLIPVIPLSALNVACGVARVPFWTYVAAAAVGVIPGSVIYAYFADQVIAGAAGADRRSRTGIIVASLLLLGLTFVPTVAARLRRPRAKTRAKTRV